MILGLGIDLVEIPRIERALSRHGELFLKRLAHPIEFTHAPKNKAQRAQYWAARFATKEAFAKALGTGIGKTVELCSVGVAKSSDGRPSLKFSASLKRTLKKRGITQSHVSITHTETSAMAIVVLEGNSEK